MYLLKFPLLLFSVFFTDVRVYYSSTYRADAIVTPEPQHCSYCWSDRSDCTYYITRLPQAVQNQRIKLPNCRYFEITDQLVLPKYCVSVMGLCTSAGVRNPSPYHKILKTKQAYFNTKQCEVPESFVVPDSIILDSFLNSFFLCISTIILCNSNCYYGIGSLRMTSLTIRRFLAQ